MSKPYWRFMFLMAAVTLYMLMQHNAFGRPILAVIAIGTAIGMLVTGRRARIP